MIKENTTTGPETGNENPAPASGPGAGAGAISWAETAAEKIAITKANNIAFAMLTWAISSAGKARRKSKIESVTDSVKRERIGEVWVLDGKYLVLVGLWFEKGESIYRDLSVCKEILDQLKGLSLVGHWMICSHGTCYFTLVQLYNTFLFSFFSFSFNHQTCGSNFTFHEFVFGRAWISLTRHCTWNSSGNFSKMVKDPILKCFGF